MLVVRQRFSATKISMSLRAGIVGLPNVGKYTLFNAVVENGKAQAANSPFCTIEPNVGIVAFPDTRLNVLSVINKSQRVVPASIEFVDIAGLVKGASQREMNKEFDMFVTSHKQIELVKMRGDWFAGVNGYDMSNQLAKRGERVCYLLSLSVVKEISSKVGYNDMQKFGQRALRANCLLPRLILPL